MGSVPSYYVAFGATWWMAVYFERVDILCHAMSPAMSNLIYKITAPRNHSGNQVTGI